MMGRIEGCGLALAGVAITIGSAYLGFAGCLGAAQDVNLAGEWTSLGLGLVGAIVGLVVFVKGLGKVASGGEELNSSPDSLRRCEHCGSHLMGDPKTCKYCGADVK